MTKTEIKDKLKDKAYAEHIAEIVKAEALYNDHIDDADSMFNSLIECAGIKYKTRLIEIGKDTSINDKEVHMTLAFREHKGSVAWAQLNYNEDLDDAREHFQAIIRYSNMIYKEKLEDAEMNDRVEGCAGPYGNDNDNDN